MRQYHAVQVVSRAELLQAQKSWSAGEPSNGVHCKSLINSRAVHFVVGCGNIRVRSIPSAIMIGKCIRIGHFGGAMLPCRRTSPPFGGCLGLLIHELSRYVWYCKGRWFAGLCCTFQSGYAIGNSGKAKFHFQRINRASLEKCADISPQHHDVFDKVAFDLEGCARQSG